MSARAEPPVCSAGPKWLRGRLGRSSLAPLTGQDARALKAFLHLLELYAVSDADGSRHAVAAMRAAVSAMQPSCRHLAKAAIPHVLDWADEGPLWNRICDTEHGWRCRICGCVGSTCDLGDHVPCLALRPEGMCTVCNTLATMARYFVPTLAGEDLVRRFTRHVQEQGFLAVDAQIRLVVAFVEREERAGRAHGGVAGALSGDEHRGHTEAQHTEGQAEG